MVMSKSNIANESDQSGDRAGHVEDTTPIPLGNQDASTETANFSGNNNKRAQLYLIIGGAAIVLLTVGGIVGTTVGLLVPKKKDDETNDDKETSSITVTEETDSVMFRNSSFIDQVCSAETIAIDGGAQCREDCVPAFYDCCNPFEDFEVLNFTTFLESTNMTLPPTSRRETNNSTTENCSLGSELQGCMAYAKCQATTELIDPAPANLANLCEDLGNDGDPSKPGSCESICRITRCCFDEDGRSCLADNLDICMDYAPCQNLRRQSKGIVPTAPDTLDEDCSLNLPKCHEECQKAACCSDPFSRCFQENFLSCLTYAPCNGVSTTAVTINIVIPDIFSRVPKPPAELIYACDENQFFFDEEEIETCADYCKAAACCYNLNPESNCFHQDPLGCVLWHQSCQAEDSLRRAWWSNGQGESAVETKTKPVNSD